MDGNTAAKRIFSDPDLLCSIINIDKEVTIRFKVILEVISAGNRIKGVTLICYLIELLILFISQIIIYNNNIQLK